MHVLIVDGHAFVCVGLKATLSEEFDDIQVTTTDHGDTALTILAKEEIDLAIVDLFMPGGAGGFNFIEMLCESYPKLPLIVLSASENPAHIRKCLDFGAAGFVTKSAPKDALFEAISRALGGERYVPESLIESMPEVARVIDEVDSGADIDVVSGLVTDRQMDITARRLWREIEGRTNVAGLLGDCGNCVLSAHRCRCSHALVAVNEPADLWGTPGIAVCDSRHCLHVFEFVVNEARSGCKQTPISHHALSGHKT